MSPSAAPSVNATRRRIDRYELIAELGSGGMATVLLARMAGAGGFARLFAIKLLHPHLAKDPAFVDMLLDEARLAARIHHSNAVPIVDVCRSPLGMYLVMDYVEGFSFARILGSPLLTYAERQRIGIQALVGVLGGLDAAHNLTDDDGATLGLVHRDVSPQNVLLGLDGVGRIVDFGIAHAGARITHTEPGTVKGKVAYMAPEQARGQRLDRRADVFAVGVMLWECLTGRRLFKGETEAATLLRLINEPILPPSQVLEGAPLELDAVCLKALERDRARRYASAHDMALGLSRAAERSGLLASSLEAADLLQERFGAEIARRREAIRSHCAAVTRDSGEVQPGELPQLPRLESRQHTALGSDLVGEVSVSIEVSASALGAAIASPPAEPLASAVSSAATEGSAAVSAKAAKPAMPRSRSHTAGGRVAIALSLIVGAAALAAWRWHVASVPARAAASALAPTAAAPPPTITNAPTPAIAAPPSPPIAAVPSLPLVARPAAVGASRGSATTYSGTTKPTAIERRRGHGAHADASGRRDGGPVAPRAEPALELNPYLHR